MSYSCLHSVKNILSEGLYLYYKTEFFKEETADGKIIVIVNLNINFERYLCLRKGFLILF